MNTLITLFFLHGILACLVLGLVLMRRNDFVLRYFGGAMLLDALAFLAWGSGVIIKPEAMDVFVNIGTILLAVSFSLLLAAGTQKINEANRQPLLVMGLVAVVGIFYLQVFAYPTLASLTDSGVLLFNYHPIVRILLIFSFALTAIPAVHALVEKIAKSEYVKVFQYGFLVQVTAFLVLLSSQSESVLYVCGWVASLALLTVWLPVILDKKSLNGVK